MARPGICLYASPMELLSKFNEKHENCHESTIFVFFCLIFSDLSIENIRTYAQFVDRLCITCVVVNLITDDIRITM